MSAFDQFDSAEDLEQYMGDPFDPDSPFSMPRTVAHDERDEFPEEGLEKLFQWNFHHHFIPEAYGGRQRALDELMMLGRVLSRRESALYLENLTSWLGTMPVYIGGSEELKRHVANMVKERRFVAFGLTERRHGADLLSSDVRATEVGGEYRITGEKWLINGAERFGGAVVLAGHEEDEDHSMFFFDKALARPGTFSHLPRYKTLGFCGIDLSGIRFEDASVPASWVLGGGPGHGLELSVKSVQLSRSEIPALSMGWADTAMRVVLDFVRSRRMYGATVLDIPHARNVLAKAFGQILACEALGVGTVRALQACPPQAFTLQAASKYFVPTILARVVQDLSVLLGVRFYLREEHWAGVFQKIVRDSLIAPMFDGSTVVNLSLLNSQLSKLCCTEHWSQDAEGERVLAGIFRLDEGLPRFAPENLVLEFCGRDDLSRSIPYLLRRLDQLRDAPDVDRESLAALSELTGGLQIEMRRIDERLGEIDLRDVHSRSVELFDCSERLCAIYAGLATVHLWIYNREKLRPFFKRGHGAVLGMAEVLSILNPNRPALSSSAVDRAIDELEALFEGDMLFSAIPVQLYSHENRITRAG